MLAQRGPPFAIFLAVPVRRRLECRSLSKNRARVQTSGRRAEIFAWFPVQIFFFFVLLLLYAILTSKVFALILYICH